MADNYTVINSCGNIITMKSKDIGAGVEAVQSIPTDTAGTPMLVLSGSAVTSTMSAQVVAISSLSAQHTVVLSSNPTVILSSAAQVTLTSNTVAVSSGTVTLSSNPTVTSVTSGSFSIINGANTAAVKAASTAPGATDPALVVTISPNSVNANGGTTSSNSAPVVNADQYAAYTAIAASQTQASLGSSAGRLGDYLSGVLVFPGVAACGVVTIFDSTATTVGTFAGGGTTALPSLVPFVIPVGAFSLSSGWKVTTGANVTVVGVGKFT